MATVLWDHVNPIDATDFLRLQPDESTWIWSGLFPTATTQSNRFRTQTRFHTRTSGGLWAAPDSESPLLGRSGSMTAYEGNIAQMRMKMLIGEQEEMAVQMAQGRDATGLIERIFDDMATLGVAVRGALEKARARIAYSGTMSLPIEGGRALTMNWNPPGSHMVTPAVLWSAASPTPLEDEMAWVDALATETPATGLPFGPVLEGITSTRVVRLLAASDEYKALFYQNTLNPPSTAPIGLPQLNAMREIYGLPPLRISDEVIDGARVVPDNRLIYRPARPVGRTLFGLCGENLEMARNSAWKYVGSDAPGFVGMVLGENEPPMKWVKIAAAVMPVVDDPNGIFCATVAS